MLDATDMTLNGRGARLMRGAVALGALALVAVALSACGRSPERLAKDAEEKAVSDRLAERNLARVEQAAALTLRHCPAIPAEGLEPFLARMTGKAAKIGPRMSPPLPVANGFPIVDEVLEGEQTPGVAMRGNTCVPLADERAQGATDSFRNGLRPEVALKRQCGADDVASWRQPVNSEASARAAIPLTETSTAPFAAAIGGRIVSGTFGIGESVADDKNSYSVAYSLGAEEMCIPSDIFHSENTRYGLATPFVTSAKCASPSASHQRSADHSRRPETT